ncbi:hypothetical protein [Paracraurococcus lichenis]|uniref:Methyl-accepting chemotaxis protein n=1 Tax=Paracraurococcus lichenis TaxID=3064888 RepID=A0ABT9EBK3_9PROT|nr:hypothetical protein [Paracraurococcus sp. LOR1-02]MDO9713589.1 hypothetical protein [Paracraurococcus sp. LOR1-02]
MVISNMSRTMQDASAAVSTVNANVAQISNAIHEEEQTVLKTREAAKILVR